MLYIDTSAAETPLYDALRAETKLVQRKTLEVGDALLCDADGTPRFAFEIKRANGTNNDWAASILDGRLREQRKRALESTSGEVFLYVYEGRLPKATEKVAGGRLTAAAVCGSILRTSLRDGLIVLHSKNAAETALLLLFSLEELRAGKLERADRPSASDVGVKKQKKSFALENPAVAALLSIPGVGVAAAEALVDRFGSLRAILAADADALADVRVTGRRLGHALAAKVHAL